MKRSFLFATALAALLPVLSFAQTPTSQPTSAPADGWQTPAGVTVTRTAPASTQPGAKNGDVVVMGYIGKLQNGTVFDSSAASGKPFSFVLGEGAVIKGWDEGVLGMQVGEKRHFVIPPAAGYGAAGSPPSIPPNATIEFDVECFGIVRVPAQ